MNHLDATIGVIMSVYNEQPSWLQVSIESILSQTYREFRFYILLDQPDNRVLRELISEYASHDDRIVFKVNDENLGLVGSLNRLITMVTEPYIARMDADDVALPERLERELQFLKEHDLDLVACGADYLDENDQVTSGDTIPDLGPVQVAECSRYGNVAIHPTWLIKRFVYQQLGGYRNCLHCEDYDLILRALQEGVRVGRLSAHLLQYRIRNSGITMTNALELEEKSRFLMQTYRKGSSIASLDIGMLNARYAGHTTGDIEAYSDAKRRVDQLAQSLYQHDLLHCLGLFLQGVTEPYFRTLFWNKFMNRMRLNRIYQQDCH